MGVQVQVLEEVVGAPAEVEVLADLYEALEEVGILENVEYVPVEVEVAGDVYEGVTAIGAALWALVELTLILTIVGVMLPIAMTISALVSSSTLGTIVNQFNQAVQNAGGPNTTAGAAIESIKTSTIHGLQQTASAMNNTFITVAQITNIVALISMFLIILAELMSIMVPFGAVGARA